ncbi:MAG: response regulator, partial [Bacteroidota bacterium]
MNKKTPKILIVDDNPKNMQVLAGFLTESGYELEYSLNGMQALQWVGAEDFDLILLDIMMPEMDGFEVCEKIKSSSKNNDLPIIFLTAKTDIESIKKAFQMGGVDYISKPFNGEELLSRVSTHIELKCSKDRLKHINKKLDELVKERTRELENTVAALE